MRTMVAGRRQNVHGGADMGQTFAHSDVARSGYVPRAAFVAILRQNGILLPDGTLHFLLVQLAKPFDSMSICYTRFMELVGLGTMQSGWSSPIHGQAFANQYRGPDPWFVFLSRSFQSAQLSHFQCVPLVRLARAGTDPVPYSYDPPFATPAVHRRGSFVDMTPRAEVSVHCSGTRA
jgi:hypothetical protein